MRRLKFDGNSFGNSDALPSNSDFPMQPPPIAEPHGDPKSPDLPILKLIEWMPLDGCFRMRGQSTFGGRLRCEIKSVRFKPANVVAVTLLFPVVVAAIAVTQVASGKKRVTTLEIWDEGVRMITPERAKLVRWGDIKKLERTGDDIFLILGGSELIFLAREGYLDAAEISKMFAILRGLWESRGANWNATIQTYAPKCETALV